jgi:WhiB family redox-sensing transcriptional regulator
MISHSNPTTSTSTPHTDRKSTVNDLIQIQPVDETLISTKPVARCADGNGTLTPLFFSDHVLDIARAKAICSRCALREQCLREALDREEPWGVWGGELLTMGRIVAHKRPGGRPPKRPRPTVVVDELGIVEFDDFDGIERLASETEPVAV